MMRLMYLEELMLIRQMFQKNTIFVIIDIFQINILSMNHIIVMVLMI